MAGREPLHQAHDGCCTSHDIRRALGINTWGMDIFRLKRRLGQQQLVIEYLMDRLRAVEGRVKELEQSTIPATQLFEPVGDDNNPNSPHYNPEDEGGV